MAITNCTQRVTPGEIRCGEALTVVLGLTAGPECSAAPLDLLLLLDCSGSMACGSKMADLRAGAKSFIRAFTSPDEPCGRSIASGSRIGLIRYSGSASLAVPLTDDAAALCCAVDRLSCGGATNHGDALTLARSLLDPRRGSRKAVLLMTDGPTGCGPDGDACAAALREMGAELWCIGVGTSPTPLYRWSGTPGRVLHSCSACRLESLFREAADRISGLSRGVLQVRLSPDFRLTDDACATHGTVQRCPGNTLLWQLDAPGIGNCAAAQLTLPLRHVGTAGGRLTPCRSLIWCGAACESVRFPQASVRVLCDPPCPSVLCPSAFCPSVPRPAAFTVGRCDPCADRLLPCVEPDGSGRIVQLHTLLKNVCPGRRVAVAAELWELDDCGRELPRGLKVFTVPAQSGEGCRDVPLRCIRFIVPDDADGCVCGPCCRCCPDCDGGTSLCRPRRFLARVSANYLDTDALCCTADTTLEG